MSEKRFPSRREVVGLGLGAFVVASFPGARRLLGGERRLIRRSVPVMGTVAELAVVGGGLRDERSAARWAHRGLDAAVAELRRVERLMTRFRPDSDVGRANLDAARRPVAVSTETAAVLRAGLAWARASDGAFDPALGRAVALWDVRHRTSPPGEEDVRPLAGRGLWHSVEVETGGSVPLVRFHDPDVSLDLGGIAKGYGVDAAARALTDFGIFDGLVNVGGDLRAAGASEDGDAWAVGIRSPDDPDGILTTLRLADAAVATSGDYLQYFDHGGRRYHHLLDPSDGAPRRTRARSLSIVAGSCMDADAAATTVYGMGAERAERVLLAAGPDHGAPPRGAPRIVHRA